MNFRIVRYICILISIFVWMGCSENNKRSALEQISLAATVFVPVPLGSDSGFIDTGTGGGSAGGSSPGGSGNSGGGGANQNNGSGDGGSLPGGQTGGGSSQGGPGNTGGGGANQNNGAGDGGSLPGGGSTGGGGPSGGGGSTWGGSAPLIWTGGIGNPNSSCSCAGVNPCHCMPIKMDIRFTRVCSEKRSDDPNFIFLEDAEHPILTLEAGYGGKCKDCKMAGRGLAADKKSILIRSLNLTNVDLLKENVVTQLNTSVEDLKSHFGSDLSDIKLALRVCDDSNRDGRCTDESTKHILSIKTPLLSLGKLPKLFKVQVWSGRHLTRDKNKSLCEKQYSPLVMDLNGDGIVLSGFDEGVWFDLDAVGIPILTGWIVGEDDALLVRDLDESDTIDSGAELFGSATLLQNGERAPNGFEALRELDKNSDAFLTEDDDKWDELSLWLDHNHDGKSAEEELFDLDEFDIKSINLNYVEDLEIDIHGNQTRQRSTYIREVSERVFAGLIIDVWFNTLVDWSPLEDSLE